MSTQPPDRESADASLRALEAGGIPVAAQQRLAELRKGGSRFFSSDLGVAEFLLARKSGFRPITQVMGSAFYNVGWQWMPTSGFYGWGSGESYELDVQTEAWNAARELALGRLREEAKQAGADAVVGVSITRGHYDWAAGLIEFVATGTAVASEALALGPEPVLTTLSGQEASALILHGWCPIGVVGGSVVCYVVGGAQTQQAMTGLMARFQNVELTDLTSGLYAARAGAMRHVERQGRELQAAGVVGVLLDQHEEPRELEQQGYKRLDLIVTLHVLGTAIAELEQPDTQPDVYVALPLTQ